MYSTNFLAESVAESAVIVHDVTSPKTAGSLPSGPWIEVSTPLFLARYAGSFLHSGQFGSASLRSPAISSSTNVDQMNIAALPAKYCARVVSTSWAPGTEWFRIRSPYQENESTHAELLIVTLPLSSVSSQPLPSAAASKVCSVNASPG